jgi:hypothetical protein
MDGLYIRKDLSNDLTKYAVPDEYVAWRARNDPRQSSYPTVAMYKEIVHRSRNQRSVFNFIPIVSKYRQPALKFKKCTFSRIARAKEFWRSIKSTLYRHS